MRITLYDTTLRDGTQREGLALSCDEKLQIARELDAVGIPYIEGGWPGSNPKDAAFFQRIREVPLRQAKIAAFGSTRHAKNRCEDDPNIRALVEAETPVVTLVGKSSVLHVEHVLGTTLDENIRMIAESVAYFKQRGKEVIYDAEHFFDGYNLDSGYALATIGAAADGGADCIVLCDTNGGALPETIVRVVRAARTRLGVGGPTLGIHTHNDGGLAVANGLAAVRAGCRHIQGTINGYGERCGNMDLIPLIANLQLKLGHACIAPEQLRGLRAMALRVATLAGIPHDDHAPYVGHSAFAHKGGIHAAAIAKVPSSYQHIEPALVGNRLRVVVSELSGRGNIRLRAAELGLGLAGDERAVLQQIKELEFQGYQFEQADGSFELLVRRGADGYEPPFMPLSYRVASAGAATQATVWVQIGGLELCAGGLGACPHYALTAALQSALRASAPLIPAQLVAAETHTAAREPHAGAWTRVFLDFACGAERWRVMGCGNHALDAGWHAVCDGIELAMLRYGQARDVAARAA